MGDTGEYFREHDAWRKEQRETRRIVNETILKESGLPFKVANGGAAWLLREHNKPKVDFYPGTGRWRVAGVTYTFRGGAVAFLVWYRKQHEVFK